MTDKTKNIGLGIGVVATALAACLITSKPKPAPIATPIPKVIVAPRDLPPTYWAEVDANNVVRQVIVMDAGCTPADCQKNTGSKNTYVQTKDPYNVADTKGINYAGIGHEYHADIGAFVPQKQFSSWPLDPQKAVYLPDVPIPADASITKPYFYVLPDKAKGETQGNWTTDKTKASAPDTGPPPAQALPANICKASKRPFIFSCSIDAPWSFHYCTTTAEVFVVAGGAGGTNNIGAGGAAGGIQDKTGGAALAITSGTGYTVTIGGAGAAGSGAQGSNGSDSVFDTTTATGGGGAGQRDSTANGKSGGSGGGAAAAGSVGAGTASQGHDGGLAEEDNAGVYRGGGGGGASAVGASGTASGDGGAGSTFWGGGGASALYGGGGGGGDFNASGGGAGGSGVGGAGGDHVGHPAGFAGTTNRGGGGGGGGVGQAGAAGGSGLVGIRAPLASSISATGGSHTTDATYDYWIFTASGTWTPTFSGGASPTDKFFQFFPTFQQDYVWHRDYLPKGTEWHFQLSA